MSSKSKALGKSKGLSMSSPEYKSQMRRANRMTHKMLSGKSKVKAYSENMRDYVGK